MRTIKFRIWDNINNKMYNLGNLEDCLYRTEFEEEFGYDLTNYIIMQYTGLKDKNGKEIYEGDIVKWTRKTWVDIYDEENGYREQTDISFIEYSIEDRAFMIESEGYGYEGEGLWNWNEIEVIGNIYENPELLTNNK